VPASVSGASQSRRRHAWGAARRALSPLLECYPVLTDLRLGKSAANDAVSAVLFVCAGQIGDCVLATGILGHLVETRPKARFTIVATPSALPLFRYVPRLDKLIALKKRRHHLHWLDLYGEVAPIRWDLVVCLRGPLLPWLLRAHERRATTRSNRHDHYVVRLARLFAIDPPPAPRLWLSARDSQEAMVVMGNEPVLALAPTANWPAKQWPPERFAEVVRRLTRPGAVLAGARVAVFGLPTQQRQTATVLAAIPPSRLIDITDGRDLGQVAACLSRARLFIGNDSGLMHIAAAAQVPTLGLFGPTPPITHGPWGEFTAVAQTATSHQELLRQSREGTPIDQLMNNLTVDQVERMAIELFWRSASATRLGSPVS
jgi:heptosyltransferase III